MGIARSIVSISGLVSVFLTGMAFAQVEYGASDTSVVSKGTGVTVAVPAVAGQAAVNARMSRNGRFVVFESTATNLVDRTQYGPITLTAGRKRIYLLDRQSGVLELVSFVARSASDDIDGLCPGGVCDVEYTSTIGTELDSDAFNPAVSGDGRYVAFSTASNARSLVTVCTRSDACHLNKLYPGTHVYVRDRWANRTFMADQTTIMCTRQVVDNFGVPQVTTDQGGNKIPSMEKVPCRVSSVIASRARAAYLTAPDFDQATAPAPASDNAYLSGDGQFAVFDTNADNLGGLVGTTVVYPLPSGVAIPAEYDEYNSATGVLRYYWNYLEPAIDYYLDVNGFRDVYVRDGSAYSTKLASFGCKYHAPQGCNVAGTADSTKGTISDDGTKVAFQSLSPFLFQDYNALSDIFMVERSKINGEVADLTRVSNNTSRLVPGDNESVAAGISGDGRYLAFESSATNIVNGDTNTKKDVFVYDSTFFTTVRCANSAGAQGNGDSMAPAINGGGDYVAFESNSTNWSISGGVKQIYIGRLSKDSNGKLIGCSVTVGTGANGTGADADASNAGVGMVPYTTTVAGTAVRLLKPAISYQSAATNLTSPSESNGLEQIYHAPKCSATDAVTDTDSDGTVDCFDACYKDDAKVIDTDADSDGISNCEDGCVNDAQKVSPGKCGCGVQDVDTDGDFVYDCVDQCPSDPLKSAPLSCGCGQLETDANGNGVADCNESALPTPAVGPTPGVTPGTTPTAIAAPTSTPLPFNLQQPQRPTINRRDARSVRVHMSLTGINGSVRSYNLFVYKRLSSGWTKVKSMSVKSNVMLLNTLSSGSYRTNFKVINTSGQSTKVSPNSTTFSIR